jgi:ubiquinone/menaquinone biosynthesis C-methylase UbiE
MDHRAYFNEMAGRWDNLLTEEARMCLKGIIDDLSIARGSTVLDVGTGTGVLIPFLAEAVGPSGTVVAVDFAAEMLAVARKKYPWPNVQYCEAEVTALPFPDETFEEVICNSAFPHFTDHRQAAKEMARVLKTGGRITVCHPHSRNYVNNLHRSIGGVVGNDLLPDDETMRAIFSAAGFRDIVIADGAGRYLLVARKNP